MARKAANGAVVSNDGAWYFTGFKFKPLVEGASGKPSMSEWSEANGMSTVASAASGKHLAKAVAEHGSLQAAEAALGGVQPASDPSAPKQEVVTYKNTAAFEADAPKRIAAGWRVQGTDKNADRTTAGRVGGGALAGTVLLPGLGTLVGGAMGAASKRKGQVQVVWERD